MNSIAAPIGGVLTTSDVGLVARTRSWNEVNLTGTGLPSPAESNTAPGGKQKRQRSANWTVDEELTLVALYRDLEKQFDTKKQLWDQLALMLQERGGFDRKPLSLEQKWGNMIQSYRAIKEHDRAKVQVAAKFFSLPFEERKSLLHQWKVNSLDDKTFESMDEFLRERADVLRPERATTATHSHTSAPPPMPLAQSLPTHPTVPAIPVRHIEVNYLLPNNILGSVANTILVKMVDAERYFAKTAAHDVEKCKQYLGLLRDCATAFKDIKDNMVNLPPNNSYSQPQQPLQQQPQPPPQQQQQPAPSTAAAAPNSAPHPQPQATPQHYQVPNPPAPITTSTLSLPSAVQASAQPQHTPSTSAAPSSSNRHHPQQAPAHLPTSQQSSPPQPLAQPIQHPTPQSSGQQPSHLPQSHQQAHIHAPHQQPQMQAH